jgi:chromosome segregation ATPase
MATHSAHAAAEPATPGQYGFPELPPITDPAARAARLERRAAGLVRQLELRIAEVEDLRARLAALDTTSRSQQLELDQERRAREHHEEQVREEREELAAARVKADEYDRIMRTKTMKWLRVPRAVYTRISRKRLASTQNPASE